MSKLIEKRRMCQKVSSLKKRILHLDSMPLEQFECTSEYKTEMHCTTDYVRACVFDIAAKNIKFAREKMQRTKEVYLALVCLMDKLKCAYMSAATDDSGVNLAVQQSVIDALKEEYKILVDTTFCDFKLFKSTADADDVILVSITNLISALSFDFQNYDLDIATGGADLNTPDVNFPGAIGGIFVSPVSGSSAATIIPYIDSLIDHFAARLAVIESVFRQLDSIEESLEDKLNEKNEEVVSVKNDVLERLAEELEAFCNGSDSEDDNCDNSKCFAHEIKELCGCDNLPDTHHKKTPCEKC
jgi:hypothetical protein